VPFPTARLGKKLSDGTDGFPLFSRRRVQGLITADPWSLLFHIALDRKKQPRAESFISQAFDFYEAAQNPRTGTKPLLYYYSFLNLAKAALVTSGLRIPPAAKHGISDPRANTKKRLRVEGQTIRINPLAKDNSEIFPTFEKLLGTRPSREPSRYSTFSLKFRGSIGRSAKSPEGPRFSCR
jgi:YaaC-like Protein